MTYLLFKWIFLAATAPLWGIFWIIKVMAESRRPKVKVVVKNYRR